MKFEVTPLHKSSSQLLQVPEADISRFNGSVQSIFKKVHPFNIRESPFAKKIYKFY